MDYGKRHLGLIIMKHYNINILISLVLFTIFSIIFNYIIDPFDIFKVIKKKGINCEKPCSYKQERMTKIPQLKFNKNNIDYIFVGSSKTQWWLNTDYHSKLAGKNILSMGLSSSSIQESIIMAENSILIHPEIKKVYFGLDFFSFSSNYYETSVNIERITDTEITKKEIMPLLISLDTLKYSFQTLFYNIKNNKSDNKIKNEQESQLTKKNKRAEHYFKETIKKYDRDYYSDYKLNKNAIKEIMNFKDFAQKRNVEVIYMVTPTHITDIINIKEHGLLKEYYEFKKILAENVNYYDLSLINEYNTESVNPEIKYFRDSIHATGVLGNLFAENFYIKQNNTAEYITKDNIDYFIMRDNHNLEDYINKNKEVVTKVKEWIK